MISQFHQHLSSEKQMSDAEKCLDKILQADIISENNERMSATKIIRTMLVVLKRTMVTPITISIKATLAT